MRRSRWNDPLRVNVHWPCEHTKAEPLYARELPRCDGFFAGSPFFAIPNF